MENPPNLLLKDVRGQEEFEEIKNDETSPAKVHVPVQLLILLKPIRVRLVIPGLQTFFFTVCRSPKKNFILYFSLKSKKGFGKVLRLFKKFGMKTNNYHMFLVQSTEREISEYLKRKRKISGGLKEITERRSLRRLTT